jgi:hypothetical protein
VPHPSYGPEHQRARLRLLRELIAGTPCPLCGEPMYPATEELDLDHSDPRAKAAGLPGDRLTHRGCNRSPLLGSHAAAMQKEWSSVDW